MAKNIINKPLNIVMSECFSRYAKYIIQDRALPDIRDGLKPVQRRILYAMNELGLTNDKPYKKSARTVGEVIGKYHPHGDSSIYEAMVRMSQDWKNNIPLLDMHGNNGSIDGDSAAAMRYTETKLAKVANLMLDDIKKETVDFNFNFDDSEKEPTVLPSLFPNLLINGAMGIAAGYATNIPTHNPSEIFNGLIYRISNPNCSVEEIMGIIKGPDFPTGGIIQGIDGIKEYFKTGKGKFIINSKIYFDESNSKINQIIIKEIPYDNNKSEILRQISSIVIDEEIPGLIEVRDESDKNGVNIVIDVKKDRNLTEIKNYLLKKTNLQVSYSTNFIAIYQKKPILVDILTALDAYISFAIEVIIKRSIFNLNKANKRIEIVQGLIKAIDLIDKIIAIIRKSDSKANAIENLIKEFEFSFIQAEAIVNLKLYRLTRTDISDLKFELEQLIEEVGMLNKLINSRAIQNKYLSKLLTEYDKEYGYLRKTLIEDNVEKIEINESAIVEEKEIIVSVTKNGYIKQVSKKSYESSNFVDISLSNSDNVLYVNNAITTDHLVLITSLGKTLVIPIYKIKNFKWKDSGQHINELVTLESNDFIVYANVIKNLNELEDYNLIILTKLGLVKKTNFAKSLNTKQLKLSSCIKIKDGDEIVGVQHIKHLDHHFITCFTSKSNAMTFSTAEIPCSEKSAVGVKAIKLGLNELLINFTLTKTLQPNVLLVYSNAFVKVALKKIEIKRRAQSPLQINKTKLPLLSVIKINDMSWINVDIENKINLIDINNIRNKYSDISSAYINQLLSTPIIEDLKKSEFNIYVPTDNNESDEQTKLLDNE